MTEAYGKNEPSRSTLIARMNTLARLEKHLLRGVTNQHDLAAAFGVSQGTISGWIAQIHKRWREESPVDTETKRIIRIRQLEGLAAMAVTEFERSRKDSEEVVIQTKMCVDCDGEGKTEAGPGEFVNCTVCGGKGEIRVETVRVKGQPGNPAYLTVAKTCIESAAKLEGVYPETVKMTKQIIEESRTVGGEFQRRVEQVVYEAPPELVIRAKAALDLIKQKVRKGEATRTIESTAEESKEKPDQE